MSERIIRHREDGPRGYRRFGGEIQTKPGDKISVETDLAERLVDEKGYFEYVGNVDTGAEASEDTDSDAGADAEATESIVTAPSEYTIDEIETKLETGNWDEQLDTLEQNEQDGKDRTGVYDAIGIRRAELEE